MRYRYKCTVFYVEERNEIVRHYDKADPKNPREEVKALGWFLITTNDKHTAYALGKEKPDPEIKPGQRVDIILDTQPA